MIPQSLLSPSLDHMQLLPWVLGCVTCTLNHYAIPTVPPFLFIQLCTIENYMLGL